MLSARIPKKNPAPNTTLKPVVLATTVDYREAKVNRSKQDDKSRFITIELCAPRVNALASSETYKKYIKKFEEDSAQQEWID
jgi:hypothetical protein